MRILLQRVRSARVEVGEEVVAAMDSGVLAFVGVERGDSKETALRLAERLAGYRLFADASGRMNLDVREAGGAVLAVPQFTLAADTRKGRRPSFSHAADPEEGRGRFNDLVVALKQQGLTVFTGRFGADMQVHLVNDGPVTFMLSL